MKTIEKYWCVAFLLCNVMMQIIMLSNIAGPLFYALLSLGLIIMLRNSSLLLSSQTVRSYRFIYAFVIITIVYQFTFGLSHINEKSWTYLAAKVVSSLCLLCSVIKYPDYYREKLIPLLSILIALFIAIGTRSAEVGLEGRSALGFGNPNDMGGIAALCFGAIFILSKKIGWKQLVVVFLCFYGALASGSRSAIGIMILGLFMKYGFKIKTVFIIAFAAGCIFIADTSGIKISGIERFVESVEVRNFDDTRITEREATIMMIRENPFSGNGLYAENRGEAAKISEMGSHNGYLDILKMFGILWGGLLILFLIIELIDIARLFLKEKTAFMRCHIFIAMTVPIASMYEAYMWGVNQMTTTLFLISLAVIDNYTKSKRINGE